MSQSLLVVTKDEEKGAKGKSAMKIQSHSLSPKTTKDELVTLLKVINDRPLFIMFLRSQRKFLETKGIINQFTKMDVKKFKELMKFTLLLRDNKDYFVDRYSERAETVEQVSQRVNQKSI